MNPQIDNSQWIGAYLEWTESEPLAAFPSSLREDAQLMQALENIEAEVRALSGRILELRSH